MRCFNTSVLIGCMTFLTAGSKAAQFDLIIRNGTIYDGSGNPPFNGDVAINRDRIAAVGQLDNARGKLEIDAKGLSVAPGFINMLSWATESLIEDGRSQSDIRQGVTLEIMGEGESMGPLNKAMKKEMIARMSGMSKSKEVIDYLAELLR